MQAAGDGASDMEDQIGGLIPASVWSDVQAKYRAYVQEYEQGGEAPTSSSTPTTQTSATTTRSGPPESTIDAEQACGAPGTGSWS